MTTSRFIVIEHNAIKARLHWDLRFKMEGSSNWASFAVRKGVPLEAGKKVLAVRTNDHSTEEALFTGTIKTGYGAGKLTKWDSGSCIIHKYSSSHIILEFKGSKVKGLYHLISTGFIDKDYKKQTYMLFKGREQVKENSSCPEGYVWNSISNNCVKSPEEHDEEEYNDDDNQDMPFRHNGIDM